MGMQDGLLFQRNIAMVTADPVDKAVRVLME